MKGLLLVLVILLAVLAQVSVAPLFPVSAAVPDLMLVTLATIAVFAGPRAAMVAIPLGAVLLSFASDHAAGLLLVGYLPLLPAAFLLDEANLPLNRYAQTLLAAVVTGGWARFVLALSAIAQGADPQAELLVTALLIPGLVLDVVLVTLVYLPFRLGGISPRALTLQRTGF